MSKEQRYPLSFLFFSSQGTEAIEGLALKLPGTVRYCFNANAFQGMNRLRLLQLDHIKLTGDYGYLSKQLRWIYWQGFPLKYIPNKFYQGNVVAIDLKHSNLKLVWKEPQVYTAYHFILKSKVNDNGNCCDLAPFSFSIVFSNFFHHTICLLAVAGVAKNPQS